MKFSFAATQIRLRFLLILGLTFTSIAVLGLVNAVWISGEYVYVNLQSCVESANITGPCTFSISDNIFTILFGTIGVIFIAADFALRNQNLLKSRFAASKENHRKKILAKELAREYETQQKNKETEERIRVASLQNSSLNNLRSSTTVLIVLGLIFGAIGATVYLKTNSDTWMSTKEKVESLVLASGLGELSTWLLSMGTLGKLLIGASKIVVEGLGGNLRQRD